MKVQSVLQALMRMPLDSEIEFVVKHDTGEFFPELKTITLDKSVEIYDSSEDGSALAIDLVDESSQKCRMVLST